MASTPRSDSPSLAAPRDAPHDTSDQTLVPLPLARVRWHLARREALGGKRLTWTDGLELLGLAAVAGVLTWLAARRGGISLGNWSSWGVPLLSIVWASFFAVRLLRGANRYRQVLAEVARHDAEVRLRAILETMAEGLLVLDHTGAIIDCNTAAGATFGHPPERLRGMTLNERDWIVLREDGSPLPAGEDPSAIALRMGRPVRNLIVGIAHPTPQSEERESKGEEIRWVLVNTMLLGMGSGAGVVATYVDVTATIRARRMQSQLEQELLRTQRLELIGRLSHGIAHDFNNLLSVVLNLTELVSGSLPASHAAQPDLVRIRAATYQAAKLANHLLIFGKQRGIAPRRIEINRVVGRTLELLRAVLPSRIALQSFPDEQELFVRADEIQVQQVLMNLCLNARDAMPEGGSLRVRTERVQRDGDWVRLSVRDNGTGMTEEIKAQLFVPYFSTKDDGTGLGLVVVRRIVESYGGRIDVASEPNRGSRFDVWWPSALEEERTV